VPQAQLTSEAWAFNDDVTESVKNKIKQVGPLLKDSSYRIFYGIKTGINEAFCIDEETKDSLIQLDKKNAEIIKPLVRGRDIARYEIKPIASWMIATKNEFSVTQHYPTIAKYLEKRDKELEGRIRRRNDQGAHWMNLRDCAYYPEMEGEKIVWLELTNVNKFTYTSGGEYILAGAFMITGSNLKALLGVMNSKLVNFYFKFISNSSGMSTTQWKKFAVENIPIPDFERVPIPLMQQLNLLVDKRLDIKLADNESEALELEREIDKIVYKLYALDGDDIALIELG
jgi:adenine-specific DNA-methyltransferase